jgi:hypothetical protein
MIAEYLDPSMTTVSVRDSNGAACFQADLMQLQALIAASTVVGVVRGKRLRYVQLLVPPDVAFRALGERSRAAAKLDRWRFTYRENVGTSKITVLKRYHGPTGSFVYWAGNEGFRPGRHNPDARSGEDTNAPLRPPIAPGIERE